MASSSALGDPGGQRGLQRLQRVDHGHAGRFPAAAHPVGHSEQAAARVRRVLVGFPDEAGIGACRVADGEGFVWRWHGGPSRQRGDEEGGEVTPARGVGLDLGPVGGDLLRGLHRAELADDPDPGQRHAEPAQPGDQPRLLELRGIVEPVSGVRVHVRGREQPKLVVQPQRLRGQPGSPGERPDRQQPHAGPPSHTGHPARCTRCCGFPQGQSQTGCRPPGRAGTGPGPVNRRALGRQ